MMRFGKFKIDPFYILMVVVLAAIIFGSVFLFHKAKTEIEDAGGVKQIIIDVGKDIKDIRKQIEED